MFNEVPIDWSLPLFHLSNLILGVVFLSTFCTLSFFFSFEHNTWSDLPWFNKSQILFSNNKYPTHMRIVRWRVRARDSCLLLALFLCLWDSSGSLSVEWRMAVGRCFVSFRRFFFFFVACSWQVWQSAGSHDYAVFNIFISMHQNAFGTSIVGNRFDLALCQFPENCT